MIKILSNAKNYLEFGSGESTILALLHLPVNGKAHSVESSKEWIEGLEKNKQIQTGLSDGRLDLIHIDIGKTKSWGRPINEKRKSHWPEYSSKIFENKIKFDTILIDGQFRAGCGLQTFINASDEALVLFHDWQENFQDYGKNRHDCDLLLNYFDLVEIVETLALLKKKKNVDKNRALEDWNLWKYISASGSNAP